MFSNTETYQDLINEQLQTYILKVNNKSMDPLLFLFKIILQIGDVTGEYMIKVNEFKYFVATTSEWKDYFKVAESILRFRDDDAYKNNVEQSATQSVQDVRIQKFIANHEFIHYEGNALTLKSDYIMRARKLVANYEISGTTTEQGVATHYISDQDTLNREEVVTYLAAIRTKPFLLIAGISGTGKSRIVKEMAYACCSNEGDLRKDPTSPGNYCLVEVKPNWNDSTELLGYETVLNGGGYHMTKFTKFVVKAMQYPDVPFFVCLDEMNLAPVEQYFAEFLSVLESRKDIDDTIKSEPLIPATVFEKYSDALMRELFPQQQPKHQSYSYSEGLTDEEIQTYSHSIYETLKVDGLRIPRNLIIVGTVNMDDTTYQFSRKVIDRAMTVEMSEVNLDKMFNTDKPDDLSYRETNNVVDKSWFFAPYAQSNIALTHIAEDERTLLTEKIKLTIGQTSADGTVTPDSLEAILGKTPFRIAYRVVNELILHFYALRWQDTKVPFETLFDTALDNILMMKVLPRIEGNEDLVKKPLDDLFTWTQGRCPKSNKKVEEMLGRLSAHFTSFWP